MWFFSCGACILVEIEEGYRILSQGQREKKELDGSEEGAEQEVGNEGQG